MSRFLNAVEKAASTVVIATVVLLLIAIFFAGITDNLDSVR